MVNEVSASGAKSMSLIVTKGTLDWAYPPFILATTAAAMGLNVTMFFTFYGLPLLLKNLDPQLSSLGNPAMKMPMMGAHMGMPNVISMIPGVGPGRNHDDEKPDEEKRCGQHPGLAPVGGRGRCPPDCLPDDHGFV